MSTSSIWSYTVTFNVLLKVSQSRAIIDRFCQEEGFELTYYIETLVATLNFQNLNIFDAEVLPIKAPKHGYKEPEKILFVPFLQDMRVASELLRSKQTYRDPCQESFFTCNAYLGRAVKMQSISRFAIRENVNWLTW